MISLARNFSLKRVYNTTTFSKTKTSSCKLFFKKVIEVRVPHRNLQSDKKSQSTEPVAKLSSNHSANVIGNEFNLATLGKTRPKIEVDGMMLNWDMAGTGDHVLLLLPGVMGTIQTDFGCLFQKMDKTKYTLVSWDPPGYGDSRPPNRDFSGIFYRRDGHTVTKLMDKLGFQNFSILGWSNGGTTALHIAADYPSRVEKIVTWCAAVYVDEQNLFYTKNMCNLDMWSQQMLEPTVAIYGKEYLLKAMQDFCKSISDFSKDDELNFALINRLPKIKCPGLFIHGEHDIVLTAKHAEFLKDHVKNSQMWIMRNAGHNLHLRYTDKFLNKVTQFLDD